jgi:hypothetical protein
MPSRINMICGVINNIAVAIPRLWVSWVGNDRIRLDKAVNIRRTRISESRL